MEFGWELTRWRYGFVSTGGGDFITKPLENVFPGALVFLYSPH